MQHILRIRKRRLQQDPPKTTAFRIRRRSINEANIERFEREHSIVSIMSSGKTTLLDPVILLDKVWKLHPLSLVGGPLHQTTEFYIQVVLHCLPVQLLPKAQSSVLPKWLEMLDKLI